MINLYQPTAEGAEQKLAEMCLQPRALCFTQSRGGGNEKVLKVSLFSVQR